MKIFKKILLIGLAIGLIFVAGEVWHRKTDKQVINLLPTKPNSDWPGDAPAAS